MNERELSPGEYRRMGLNARRWSMCCIDAGETSEALHQIKEAARFFDLAEQIERERNVAA